METQEKTAKREVTVRISSDGYGPEAEERGPDYIRDLHEAYIAYVSRRLGEDLLNFTDIDVGDLGCAGDTTIDGDLGGDRALVRESLAGAWEDWCATEWNAWESQRDNS